MKSLFWLLAIFALLIFSCSSNSDNKNYAVESMAFSPQIETIPGDMVRGKGSSDMSIESPDKKIQRNASLSIEVKNIDKSLIDAKEIITKFDGEIINSDSGGFGFGQPYANIKLRVISENLNVVLIELKKISTNIISENIYTNDVTEEFIDIEARLKVMKSTEDRFNSLLSSTETVEEIIQVEKELMRIRSDIDSLEGRLNYLSKTTNMSEINLNINEQIPITGESWKLNESFTSALQNLSSFVKSFANLAINFIVFIPVIIVGIIIIVFVRKLIRKRNW